MKVFLLQHTPQPETLVASAAKLCYSKSNIENIMQGLEEEKTREFLNMLVEIGHESPIEHVSFTFGIEGVSRSLLAQITRHRIASFSVKSQRYVKEGQFEYIVPPEIENEPQAKEIYFKTMEDLQKQYNVITDILSSKHYNTFLEEGKSEKNAKRLAEKKAIEDARFILPNACETKIIITLNARSLLNFFKHRCCNRAQWEIRNLAVQMLKLVRQVAPTIFKNAGPPCLNGKCSEGKMTCGKIEEVRKFYQIEINTNSFYEGN